MAIRKLSKLACDGDSISRRVSCDIFRIGTPIGIQEGVKYNERIELENKISKSRSRLRVNKLKLARLINMASNEPLYAKCCRIKRISEYENN